VPVAEKARLKCLSVEVLLNERARILTRDRCTAA
jgi:hypothetical protein